MCESCILSDGGAASLSEVRRAIRHAKLMGKSKEYCRGLMKNEPHKLGRRVSAALYNTGGKSYAKGKGKGRRAPPPRVPANDGRGLRASDVS